MRLDAIPLRALALAALLAATSLTGCIQGTFAPAEVPSSGLAAGWRFSPSDSQAGEEGVQPIVVAKYQVNTYKKEPTGVLYVISVTDVPIVDEQSVITDELNKRLEEEQFSRTQTFAGTGTIQGEQASYTLYDATARLGGLAPVNGRAVEAQFTCQPSGMAVRSFGFTAGASDWVSLVGGNPQDALGGMVAQVRCAAG